MCNLRSRLPILRGLFCLAAAGLTRLAAAAPVASEPFEYPTNSTLDNQAGGSGFTSVWQGLGASSQTGRAASPGLTNAQLGGTGNRLSIAAPTNTEYTYSRNVSPVTADGSVVWLRFLLRPDTIPSSGSPAGGIGITGNTTSGPFIGLGDSSGGIYVSKLNVGAPSVTAPTKAVAGNTYLLLVRMTLTSGNDPVDLWVNPDVSKPLPAPDVTNSQIDFNIGTVNLVAFDNAAVSIDEIKLGTTLADVVPEPPVAGLVLFPAALFLRRSERRRPAASRLPCPR